MTNILHFWWRVLIETGGFHRHEQAITKCAKYLKEEPRWNRKIQALGWTSAIVVWQTFRQIWMPQLLLRYLILTGFLHGFHRMIQWVKQLTRKAYRRFLHSNGRKLRTLEQQLQQANTYAEWKTIGTQLDLAEGRTKWREDPVSSLYPYERVRTKIDLYRYLMMAQDLPTLMFELRAGLQRKQLGFGHRELFQKSHVGTKYLIDEYMDTIVEALNTVVRATPAENDEDGEASLENKLAFFSETRHAFGRSALMLSGGGGLGMYHCGLVKTLIEQNCLPTVIAGSSAGSIVAGMIGVRTDSEYLKIFTDYELMNNLFFGLNITPRDREKYIPTWVHSLSKIVPWIVYQHVEVFTIILQRFFERNFLMDNTVLAKAIRENIGDLTFREAYDRTGRIINITVTPKKLQRLSPPVKLSNGPKCPSLVGVCCFLLNPEYIFTSKIIGER